MKSKRLATFSAGVAAAVAVMCGQIGIVSAAEVWRVDDCVRLSDYAEEGR
jgi:hypothetical protein